MVRQYDIVFNNSLPSCPQKEILLLEASQRNGCQNLFSILLLRLSPLFLLGSVYGIDM